MENPEMTLVIHSTPDTTTVELFNEDDPRVLHFLAGSNEVSNLIVALCGALMECPFEVIPPDAL